MRLNRHTKPSWRAAGAFFVALAALASAGCAREEGGRVDPDGTLHGRVSLSGAFALYPLAVRWANDFTRLHPDVRVEVDAGGAGKGITDALTGMVDFGMLSRELGQDELGSGAEPFVVAKDAVVPTISLANPHYAELVRRGLTREVARRVWTGDGDLTWGEILGNDATDRVVVFTRSDACGAADTWASWFGLKQEDLKGEGLNGDPSVAAAVAKEPAAIGFNNVGFAYDSRTHQPVDGLRVLPIDIDGNGQIDPEEDFYATSDELARAISRGLYPTPPARNLYLVSRGVPTDPVARAFLDFVATAGQARNAEAGYTAISADQTNDIHTRLGL
ncbi:MAG: PstS family phosphate ABC transporter substrate-binding protein [Marinilabiliaceae bacterium]